MLPLLLWAVFAVRTRVQSLSTVPRAWTIADRVSAASAATGQVAWRRLARELGVSSAADLRDSWLEQSGKKSELPLLPLLEPWEYSADDHVRGVVDGMVVELDAKPGGDHGLSQGIFEAGDGSVYEVGAPSEKQLTQWTTNDVPQPLSNDTLDWRDYALATSAPLGLAALAVGLGLLTHHLQIQIFVI